MGPTGRLAAQPDYGASQAFARQPLATGAAHAAMVDAQIGLLAALAQHPAQFVAQQPASFCHEAAVSVQATHGVAPADAELVLHGQAREVVLHAQLAVPAQSLRTQFERGVELHIRRSQGKARGAFIQQFLRRRAGVEGSGAPLVAQGDVQAGGAKVLPVVELDRPARRAAALHVDFHIVYGVVAAAPPAFQGHAGFAAGVAIQHAPQRDFCALAVAAVAVVLHGTGYRLVVVVFAEAP